MNKNLLSVLTLALGISILAAGVAINFNKLPTPLFKAQSLLSSPLTPQRLAPIDLTSKESYQGLPVAQVKSYNTPDAWGTAIYVPQYHKSSVAKAGEAINNIAEKNQTEIYRILKFLTAREGIDFVMVEGNLYGQVPAPQITKLSDKIEKRETLASLYQSLKEALQKDSINPSLESKLLKDLEDEIAKIDREIILSGAARKLQAEDGKLKLYGSEDEALHEQGLAIYKDFSYLSERIKELESPDKAKSKNEPLSAVESNQQILSLLNPILKQSSMPPFNSLKSQATTQGKTDIAQLIQKTENAYYTLVEKPATPNIQVASTKDKSEEANPYEGITNINTLKEKHKEAKKKVDEVVIDERNKKVAENFAQGLKAENESVGILQFGAGHGEALVKELQNQGLSVIVVSSEEVVKQGN